MFLSTFSTVTFALSSLAAPTISTKFPSSYTIFSSNFHEPSPPLISAEYKANWNQHKWNQNISHIATGYLYNSPTHQRVRVDETYDNTLGSSLFDYRNISSQDGGVANYQWLLNPAAGGSEEASCFRGYVQPGFPLVERDVLVMGQAVFGGEVVDEWVGEVVKWNLLYQGAVPTVVLVDRDNVVQGYDFWGRDERTYVVTRFFNVVLGKVDAGVFESPCM